MPRHINLRQVEAFKAVIENGTISRAATALNISQPAMSKAIANLETDTGLKLFDRIKGRLAPTARGIRLYEEIDRIFAGVRQVENAVEAIRREEQGQLLVGVLPALSGSFIQQCTTSFLAAKPGVFCSVQSRSSLMITDWLVTRKLDVGLVNGRIDNPFVVCEPLLTHPMVCVMPNSHRLAGKAAIVPSDLDGQDFVSFDPESGTARRIAEVLEACGASVRVAMVANVAPTLCEFVAAGVGMSLVHPLMASGFEGRLAVRRFEPATPVEFQLCRASDSRNAGLVNLFIQEVRSTAEHISRNMLREIYSVVRPD